MGRHCTPGDDHVHCRRACGIQSFAGSLRPDSLCSDRPDHILGIDNGAGADWTEPGVCRMVPYNPRSRDPALKHRCGIAYLLAPVRRLDGAPSFDNVGVFLRGLLSFTNVSGKRSTAVALAARTDTGYRVGINRGNVLSVPEWTFCAALDAVVCDYIAAIYWHFGSKGSPLSDRPPYLPHRSRQWYGFSNLSLPAGIGSHSTPADQVGCIWHCEHGHSHAC